jgi:hypothetical protein
MVEVAGLSKATISRIWRTFGSAVEVMRVRAVQTDDCGAFQALLARHGAQSQCMSRPRRR